MSTALFKRGRTFHAGAAHRTSRMKSALERSWLIAAFIVTATNAFAQRQFNVLDWNSHTSLFDYLDQHMHQQYDARRLALHEALRSKTAAESYARECRGRILQVLGSFPEKTPLHPMITGRIKENGYEIVKIVYESFEHHHVTANLYVPDGKGPFPATLLFCGHEDASKATDSYHQTAVLFAENGFVVLVIDPISQSERRQLTDSSGTPQVRGGTTEHTLLNATSNLLGTSTAAYELWDNVRGLDYLESRPDVDRSRIGCLGNSGGGMQTVYFLGFEKRVRVAAVCSFLSSRERNFDLSILSDGCSQMPDEGKYQLEMSDYLIAAAPTPILILAGRYDFIDYTGTVAAYDDVRLIDGVLGVPGRASLFTVDDGHGISKPKREAAVTWFRRWLCNDSTAVHEPTINSLSEKELMCTTTGQVNSQYADEITVERRNLAVYDSLQSERKAFLHLDREAKLKDVTDLLSITEWNHHFTVENLARITMDDISWQKLIIRKNDEVPLPLLEAYPPGSPKKVIAWFPGQGKGRMADSVKLMHDYLQQGCIVLLCDATGVGETSDIPLFNDPKYYNEEYRNAMLAIHIGRSLVGERVKDVLSVLDVVRSDRGLEGLPLEMNASGVATLPALHALLFDTTVSKLNLYGSLRTFKTILLNPTEKNWYSYVIPGVLRSYDIPDLVDMVGVQRVHFVNN